MDLSAEADVAAPIDWTFERFADFQGFERAAAKRGATIARKEPGASAGPGTAWDIRFNFRGRERHLEPVVTEWAPPGGYALVSDSQGLLLTVRVTLAALGPERTRARLEIEMAAKGMGGKLLLQSLKLGRGKLAASLRDRLTGYCGELSAKYAG
ncbi:SRPBCC family protein [Pseudoroseicyclus sp. H15]